VRILAFSDLHRDEQAGRSLVERSPQVDVVARVGEFASMHRGLQRMIDAGVVCWCTPASPHR
jgi:uncharacterized protein